MRARLQVVLLRMPSASGWLLVSIELFKQQHSASWGPRQAMDPSHMGGTMGADVLLPPL